MKVSFANLSQPTSGAAVIFALEGRKLTIQESKPRGGGGRGGDRRQNNRGKGRRDRR